MNTFKKTYRYIAIILALLVTFVFTYVASLADKSLTVIINNPPTEEDYLVLKDYCYIYAQTLDTTLIDNEEVEIIKELKDDSIIITANEFRCKVEAKYPIEFKQTNNGEFITSISFDEGEYTEYSNLESLGFYITVIIVFFIFWFALNYMAIYFPVILIADIIAKIIERKKNKEDKNVN